MLCNLQYAITADGRTVHICEVERGAACGCLCPGCGKPLVARKGDEVEHHFAHADGSDCPTAFRSSIFCALKKTFEGLGYIALPAYIKNRSLSEESGGTHVIIPQTKVRVTKVELIRSGGSISSILLYSGEHVLQMGLLTSYSDNRRSFDKAKRLGMALIELDLSREDMINDDILKGYVTKRPNELYWVYNPLAEAVWDKLLASCIKLSVNGGVNDAYTYGCSEQSRRSDGNKCYLKVGCAKCEFFFGTYGIGEDRYMLCGRQNVVSQPEDLKLTLQQRKKKYGFLC